MRSSIYFLLALISSPALAAPTFASKRDGENGQTAGFDTSRFTIGTATPPTWNRLFGIGPVIPNPPTSKRAPQTAGSSPDIPPLNPLAPPSNPGKLWMPKSRTSKRAPVMPEPVVWKGDHYETISPGLGPELTNPPASKRAAQFEGPFIPHFVPGLGMVPVMVTSSTSKRAPLSPLPPFQDVSDSWGNFLNTFGAGHSNSAFTRDTSEQDRFAQLSEWYQNYHNAVMRDTSEQDSWFNLDSPSTVSSIPDHNPIHDLLID